MQSQIIVSAIKTIHMGLPCSRLSRRIPPKLVLPIFHLPYFLQNFNVSTFNVESNPSPKGSPNSKNPGKHCKLYSSPHSMSQCDNYKSLSDLQVRCVNLEICKLCTSLKLNTSSCPG